MESCFIKYIVLKLSIHQHDQILVVFWCVQVMVLENLFEYNVLRSIEIMHACEHDECVQTY